MHGQQTSNAKTACQITQLMLELFKHTGSSTVNLIKNDELMSHSTVNKLVFDHHMQQAMSCLRDEIEIECIM